MTQDVANDMGKLACTTLGYTMENACVVPTKNNEKWISIKCKVHEKIDFISLAMDGRYDIFAKMNIFTKVNIALSKFADKFKHVYLEDIGSDEVVLEVLEF